MLVGPVGDDAAARRRRRRARRCAARREPRPAAAAAVLGERAGAARGRLRSSSRRRAGVAGAGHRPSGCARIEEGRLAHRLMQSLPDVAPERRRAAATSFLARHGARARRPSAAPASSTRALALIEAPELSALFAPGSRAEVPVVADACRATNGETVSMPGRIDRLAATANEVWIADYKTGSAGRAARIRAPAGALPRGGRADVSRARQVRAFLLWIDTGDFQELSGVTLSKAYQDWAGES